MLMNQNGFDVLQNPHGILFNPMSIAMGLGDILLRREYKSEDLIIYNGRYISLRHHGLFSSTGEEATLRRINEKIQTAHTFLLSAHTLIITWGTAFVYEYLPYGSIVANCHKIPQEFFTKRMLSCEEIVEKYRSLLATIFAQNSQIHLLFTLSPVRHWKDGATQNLVSKSTLRMSIHQLETEFDQVSYFPAYEIMMDDLRDYRFYKEDMIHLTDQAVSYIWQKFIEAFFNEKTKLICRELSQLRQLIHHRPIHAEGAEYDHYLITLEQKILEIKKKYPFLQEWRYIKPGNRLKEGEN